LSRCKSKSFESFGSESAAASADKEPSRQISAGSQRITTTMRDVMAASMAAFVRIITLFVNTQAVGCGGGGID
jgi:hypothetical protein